MFKPKNINSQHLHHALSEFVIEPGNHFAYEIAQQLAHYGSIAYNPIVFYGPTNSGKSHLIHSINKALQSNIPDLFMIQTDGTDFFQQYFQGVKHKSYQLFREFYRSGSLLLFENLHLLRNKKKAQDELLFIVNNLLERKVQIVFSSRYSLETIGFSPALANRLRNGLSLQLKPLSLETIVSYYQKRASSYNIIAEKQAIQALWEQCQGSFSDFRIIFNKMLLLLASQKQNLLAGDLGQIHVQNLSQEVTLDAILDAIGKHFQIEEPQQLRRKSGSRSLTIPRYLAIVLARELLHMSVSELKIQFGNRSSTAIRNAINKVAVDDSLQSILIQLRKRLKTSRQSP